MGRYLKFDDSYFLQGLVPLYRGDDWFLTGKIRNVVNGNYWTDVNLAGISATAYFPADPSVTPLAVIPAPVVIDRPDCGSLQISLAAASTPLVLMNPNGVNCYVVTQLGATGTFQTYNTLGEPLAIQDRTFNPL